MHEHSNHDSVRHRWPTVLVNDEEIAFFMADALETGYIAYIAKALSVVARVKGMTEIAQKPEFSRE
jgi:probable addiction module antidote protein